MGTATPFQVEAWTEFGVGTCILLLRLFARWKSVGFKAWQGDDYLAFLAIVLFTAELCMLELIGQNGTNINVTEEAGAVMGAEEIARREFGSKCLLIGWTCYVSLIWTLKGCMLFFFNRMTLGLAQRKTVKVTGVVCVVGYVVMIVVLYGHCVPIQRKWQVFPDPGDRCTIDVENYLALVVINVITDCMIVSIPVPLLWKVKISIKRKLIIGGLLCSGVFIMVATILRCVLALRDIDGINTSTIWSIRETFIGILVVNAPAIKTLFAKTRFTRGSSGGGGGGSNGKSNAGGTGNNNGGRPGTAYGSAEAYKLQSLDDANVPRPVLRSASLGGGGGGNEHGRTGSSETLMSDAEMCASEAVAGLSSPPSSSSSSHEIVVKTTPQVHNEGSGNTKPSGFWERGDDCERDIERQWGRRQKQEESEAETEFAETDLGS